MELASSDQWRNRRRIRPAVVGEAAEISRLISRAKLRHLHADWRLPADWLGSPGFVLLEQLGAGDQAELIGCLAVGADPPPAAWVRVAAMGAAEDGEGCLRKMIAATLPWLHQNGVSILGWLPELLWPEAWLRSAGLQKVNWIVTYGLDEIQPRPVWPGNASIRPVRNSDFSLLAAIEQAAFEPLWRTSAEGLLLAYGQALSFDVAHWDGRIVGFQYSVTGHDGASAHLVRLTVLPEAQGRGVGSALMTNALNGYAQAGLTRVTLNTQLDNHSSHRLYERFGFRKLGDRVPVWAMALT